MFWTHSKKDLVEITKSQFEIKFRRNFQFSISKILIKIGECNSRSKRTDMIYMLWCTTLVSKSWNYVSKLHFITHFEQLMEFGLLARLLRIKTKVLNKALLEKTYWNATRPLYFIIDSLHQCMDYNQYSCKKSWKR
jgi:hypothetical protein